MSKFRPSFNSIYVIPDIHGHYDQLKLICKRILPLRKSDGGKDTLIFLGDYIDRGPNSPEVLDYLIEIKERYDEQIIFLRGNHEQMLLTSLGALPENPDPFRNSSYSMWVETGGDSTLKSYAARQGIVDNPLTLPRRILKDLIPKNHIEFMLSTALFHETDSYIFVHAGCDPGIPLSEQDGDFLVWDRSLFLRAKNILIKNLDWTWEKPIITGHNHVGPFITEKFMMLDCSGAKKLIITEL